MDMGKWRIRPSMGPESNRRRRPLHRVDDGVCTDNQPDFTWLQPYEEKSFSQYFMPYKHIGIVKNASIDAAVNLELNRSEGTAQIGVYVTSSFRDAVVKLSSQRKVYIQETLDLTPNKAFMQKTVILAEDEDYELCLTVKDVTGRELISYQPKKKEVEQMPAAAAPCQNRRN